MSVEENKANQRRVWEEVFNKGNLAIIPEFFATNYVYHGPMGMEVRGPEGFRQLANMFRTAFSDVHVTVEDMIAEGDKVVSLVTITGIHKGEFMGIAPTDKKFTYTGMLIDRWEGGKEVEARGVSDMLAFMQQIGVVPPIGQG
jgi:predicted ester cyclase